MGTPIHIAAAADTFFCLCHHSTTAAQHHLYDRHGYELVGELKEPHTLFIRRFR